MSNQRNLAEFVTGSSSNTVTVTAGTGMSGGGSASLGGTVTLTNAGVTSVVAGTGVSVNRGTGAVTVTNSGVTSITGTANQITASASTGAVTLSIPTTAITTNWEASGGLYAQGAMSASYTDGIVADYSSGNGRISVGTSDTLTFYNGGVANTQLGQFSTTGLLQATAGFQAPSTGPFFLNATTVSANYTIPSNYNATSAGKITINTGVTVTVSTGSRWVVV